MVGRILGQAYRNDSRDTTGGADQSGKHRVGHTQENESWEAVTTTIGPRATPCLPGLC